MGLRPLQLLTLSQSVDSSGWQEPLEATGSETLEATKKRRTDMCFGVPVSQVQTLVLSC